MVTRSHRFTVAGLMGIVLVASLGLTALRSSSATWAGAMFLTTCGVLGLAVVGAACRSGAERAWWLGFALFGWGYVALRLWEFNLPTVVLFNALRPHLGIPLGFNKLVLTDAYEQVGHCLFAIMAAALGGLLARVLFGAQAAGHVANEPRPRRESQTSRKRWRRPTFIGAACLLVASCVGLLGLRWVPGFLAAVALLSTWGLLGLAIVGAVCGRGRRRAAWLGAALFGIGYMTLVLRRDPDYSPNWPYVATDRLLNEARSWLPDFVRAIPALNEPTGQANQRILKALYQPVSLRFPDLVTLEDFVKAVQAATKDPEGHVISIHVDPLGLQESEKTLTSVLVIDLEGVPLRTALRLALKQLDLGYTVMDGVLIIGRPEDMDGLAPIAMDPFLVAGHCLLTVLAPFISSRHSEVSGPES